jgi:hypothetical protein
MIAAKRSNLRFIKKKYNLLREVKKNLSLDWLKFYLFKIFIFFILLIYAMECIILYEKLFTQTI